MEKKTSFTDKVRQHLNYSLSLPERTVRSLAAVAGGTTTLLTDTLLPESMRQTHHLHGHPGHDAAICYREGGRHGKRGS